jgi:glucan phosphorylase
LLMSQLSAMINYSDFTFSEAGSEMSITCISFSRRITRYKRSSLSGTNNVVFADAIGSNVVR